MRATTCIGCGKAGEIAAVLARRKLDVEGCSKFFEAAGKGVSCFWMGGKKSVSEINVRYLIFYNLNKPDTIFVILWRAISK